MHGQNIYLPNEFGGFAWIKDYRQLLSAGKRGATYVYCISSVGFRDHRAYLFHLRKLWSLHIHLRAKNIPPIKRQIDRRSALRLLKLSLR